MPKATIYGLLIAAVCYVASSTVIAGIIPHEVLKIQVLRLQMQ